MCQWYKQEDDIIAVTGVNNYSNTYTNAYTSNVRKNNAKETAVKQAVEQTEEIRQKKIVKSENTKEEKEVFMIKKDKNASPKNNVDLKM